MQSINDYDLAIDILAEIIKKYLIGKESDAYVSEPTNGESDNTEKGSVLS